MIPRARRDLPQRRGRQPPAAAVPLTIMLIAAIVSGLPLDTDPDRIQSLDCAGNLQTIRHPAGASDYLDHDFGDRTKSDPARFCGRHVRTNDRHRRDYACVRIVVLADQRKINRPAGIPIPSVEFSPRVRNRGHVASAASLYPPSAAGRPRASLNVVSLVRKIMLVPERIENAASAGESNAENPGEVPHGRSPQ